MNYFTEIATWILKCTFIAYHCVPPFAFPCVSWNFEVGERLWPEIRALEVRELCSPASYYTLTTAYSHGCWSFVALWLFAVVSVARSGCSSVIRCSSRYTRPHSATNTCESFRQTPPSCHSAVSRSRNNSPFYLDALISHLWTFIGYQCTCTFYYLFWLFWYLYN